MSSKNNSNFDTSQDMIDLEGLLGGNGIISNNDTNPFDSQNIIENTSLVSYDNNNNNNDNNTEVDLLKHPSGLVPTLHNIVATVNLECRLDLKTIALHARNAEYNPKRFAAVVMRIREPKTTALIFASGRMVITGAKSEEFCRLAARKFARIIQKLGFPAKFSEFKIQNIVGRCDVKFPVRLEGLAFSHGHFYKNQDPSY